MRTKEQGDLSGWPVQSDVNRLLTQSCVKGLINPEAQHLKPSGAGKETRMVRLCMLMVNAILPPRCMER